jgi:excisionase family DNA binding protein
METEFISTTEAASLLKITRQRVLDFIKDGRLSASKLGNVYMIRKSDLALVAERKTGRPKKAEREGEAVKAAANGAAKPTATKVKKAPAGAVETKLTAKKRATKKGN